MICDEMGQTGSVTGVDIQFNRIATCRHVGPVEEGEGEKERRKGKWRISRRRRRKKRRRERTGEGERECEGKEEAGKGNERLPFVEI